MIGLYNILVYHPIYNLLVGLSAIMPGHNFGLAIILLTVVLKVILLPLTIKSTRSQKALQDLQPKMEELKRQYKDQKEKLTMAMMDLYKKEKVNPFSSCLPLLIQLPFLIAVYSALRHVGEGIDSNLLYSFVPNPGSVNMWFVWMDLAKAAPVLAVLAGIAQYFQVAMLSTKPPAIKSEGSKDEDMTAMMNKQMKYMMPIMTIFIGISLPGGLTLYWFIMTIATIAQQYFIFKGKPNKELQLTGK